MRLIILLRSLDPLVDHPGGIIAGERYMRISWMASAGEGMKKKCRIEPQQMKRADHARQQDHAASFDWQEHVEVSSLERTCNHELKRK